MFYLEHHKKRIHVVISCDSHRVTDISWLIFKHCNSLNLFQGYLHHNYLWISVLPGNQFRILSDVFSLPVIVNFYCGILHTVTLVGVRRAIYILVVVCSIDKCYLNNLANPDPMLSHCRQLQISLGLMFFKFKSHSSSYSYDSHMFVGTHRSHRCE
jgi:hypothetical protein